MATGKQLVEIADGLRTGEGYDENLKNVENVKSYALDGMNIIITDDEARKIQQCLQDLERENDKNGNWSHNWYAYVVYPLTE